MFYQLICKISGLYIYLTTILLWLGKISMVTTTNVYVNVAYFHNFTNVQQNDLTTKDSVILNLQKY